MFSGWRRRAPIRCHYTRCLRIPLAGGERSCAQNQLRCSHSPCRSRAANIIRFERLGAVITSSQSARAREREREKERESPVIRQCSLRSYYCYRSRRCVNRTFCCFIVFLSLFAWNVICCSVLCVKNALSVLRTGSVGFASWLQPAMFCADAKTHRPVQN